MTYIFPMLTMFPPIAFPDWATPTPLAEACDFPRPHEQGVRSPDGRYEPKLQGYLHTICFQSGMKNGDLDNFT